MPHVGTTRRRPALRVGRTLPTGCRPLLTRLRRLAVLRAMPHQRACVSDINAAAQLTLPTVSYHRQILRRAALVTRTKHGSHVYCQINDYALEAVVRDLTSPQGLAQPSRGRSWVRSSPVPDRRTRTSQPPSAPVADPTVPSTAVEPCHTRSLSGACGRPPLVGNACIYYEAPAMPGDPDQRLFIRDQTRLSIEEAMTLQAHWTNLPPSWAPGGATVSAADARSRGEWR